MQPRLFDEGGFDPLARSSDPPTSHQAAEHIAEKMTSLARAMYFAFAAGHKTSQEAAQEAARAYGGIAESYRKRTKELVTSDRIRVCGERRCKVTGRQARVFEVLR